MWNENFDTDTTDSEGESPNFLDSEGLMKEIQLLYTTKDIGLRDSAHFSCNYKLAVPRQKITVFIVGHHTHAKQKFLDLYFDEPRQGHGSIISKVDYNKLDKIYITQGNRQRWLSGEDVLDYCPQLAKLKDVPGLKDFLATEISTKKTKSLVSFVLAPENVPSAASPSERKSDTNNNNLNSKHLDVEVASVVLADAADLIFVFFDPTKLIPPKVTLKPLQNVWKLNHEKIHLVLAKAEPDECTEEAREDVLTQIVRETWRIQDVRDVGYVPLIYCPDLTSGAKDDDRLWSIIQTATDKSVQRALHQLELDASRLLTLLQARWSLNEEAKKQTGTGNSASCYLWLIVMITILFAIWIADFNETILCRNPGSNWKAVCKEMMSNSVFITILGSTIGFFTLRSLIMGSRTTALTQPEEDLLAKRITFAKQALRHKETLEKKYIANNSPGFYRN